MDDVISRQQAIDALKRKQDDGKGDLSRFYNTIIQHDIEAIMQLPSAQPEHCGDAVSRNAIVQKLNKMDRYVSAELRLCDTDNKFPQNEVFIVDDVYEEIVEQLPSVQPKRGRWIYKTDLITAPTGYWECSECKEGRLLYEENFCPNCGAKMEGADDE